MTDFGKVRESDLQDFDDFFCDFLPDELFSFDAHRSSSSGAKTPIALPDSFAADNAASLSIGEIENLLLNDDFESLTADDADAFLSDLLVDSPSTADAGSDSSASGSRSPAIECCNAKDSSPSDSDGKPNQLPQQEEKNHGVNNDENDNDPVAKKRKRQLRNRDAAVRSRERKKMYVRELEMKSRYYEAECRRLEWTLQCAVAENHALQYALHSNHRAFGTSSTKQESAVLLLESLLLGSLLWVMGIIGLFLLPGQMLAILEAALLEDVEGKKQRSPAPRKMESNIFGMSVFRSFMNGKRWRGSRTRMKAFAKRMLRCLNAHLSLVLKLELMQDLNAGGGRGGGSWISLVQPTINF